MTTVDSSLKTETYNKNSLGSNRFITSENHYTFCDSDKKI